MRTNHQTVAAGHSVELDPACWQELFDQLMHRVAGRFARADLRRRARAFVRGLLADLPRKNCWTIAEYAGDPNPDGMQHLLARVVWDHDKVRDDIRDYVVEQLGDPQAVLVVDETGDLKKGSHTVGVQRQYTGTAGRIGNIQVAVYLVYATDAGHAVVDRVLYLPRSWTDDPACCRAVGVPDQVVFATKPELATTIICRALDAGVPASWVTGDEVYGNSPALRAELEGCGVGYVLVVARDHRVRFGGTTCRANALLRHVPARAWQCVSAGKGAKGHRLYDWAFLRLDHDGSAPCAQAGRHWLMIRRNRSTGELAFYRCFTPRPTPLAVLVRVAGRRWTVEEAFQAGKGLSWSGPPSGPPLALVVSLGHPGDARPRLPRGRRLGRTHPAAGRAWARPVDLQGGPAPVCGPGHPTCRRDRPPVALVAVATPTPGPRPHLPLPTTGHLATMEIVTRLVWGVVFDATPMTVIVMAVGKRYWMGRDQEPHVECFAPIDPFEQGMLDVGDGQRIYWEASGNPDGKPVVVLHGGPGSGSSPERRRLFDPQAYLIVQFDQCGCGRSTPHAGDPATDLSAHTTHHLIADMEQLREQLGVQRWLVWGGSWGVTLGLVYAEQYPQRVSELVLASVTMTRPGEVHWLYHEVGRYFPEQWERFRNGVPAGARDGDLVAAYYRLLNQSSDLGVRERAAQAWCTWEDELLSNEEGWQPNPRYDDPAFRMAFARIVTHYFRHHAWLADDQILRDADRLAGIPGVLIHGRFDLDSPADTAWLLAKAGPDAELHLVGTGHAGGAEMTTRILKRPAGSRAGDDGCPLPLDNHEHHDLRLEY